MASSSGLAKNKGPIIDPALCRCCRSIKKCRLLTTEYEWLGKKEVYADMFMDCFGLVLSHVDTDSMDCCICATCVVRLREASSFRRQVLQSEELFLRTRLAPKEDGGKVEVKIEPIGEYDSDDNMDDRHADDDPPEPVEIKVDVKEPQAEPDSRAARAAQRALKRQLLLNVQKMSKKLDLMLDSRDIVCKVKTPVKKELKKIKLLLPPKSKITETKKRKLPKTPIKEIQSSETDNDFMIYSNTIIIVNHSYVIPFRNRISFYYCYYCRDQFTNPTELRDHTWTHNPVTEFQNSMENRNIPKIDITRIDCRLCDEKIEDLEAFKRHITSVHEKFVYPITNEFLKFKLTMDSLKCTECSAVFPYFDALKKHMTDHFGTYICDVCGACFLERNSLRTHIKSHNKVEESFPCEICGKNLKSKYSRYLHVATVHEKKPTVNCYKCEQSFMSYAQRNRHLIEAHGDKRTFACTQCDKVYNRRKTLMEHHRRNHLKVMRHQCDVCDQKFYLPSRLRDHMSSHTGERNFRCDLCDKSYPRLQSLQEHIRWHSNERRHKCDVCNTTFTQSGSLRSHMKSHHQAYDMDNSYS